MDETTAPSATTARPPTPAGSKATSPATAAYPLSPAQAFFTTASAATPPPAFFPPAAMASSQPYLWGAQAMLTPYGTPIYSPVYFQGGTFGHPSMAMAAGTPYPVAEAEGSSDKKRDAAAMGKSGDEYDDEGNTQSESEGSSEARDESSDPQDSSVARKRNIGGSVTDAPHSASRSGNTVESSYSGRGQTSGKLPVSAPGRVVIAGPSPNLNIGMDLWNVPHADAALMKTRPNVGIGPVMGSSTMVERKGAMPDQKWIRDENELKKQKRKQSNRESARRSRLRKQQECEELARRMDELSNENNVLRSELEQLNKDCKKLASENTSIMEELTQLYGPGVLSALASANDSSRSIQSVGGEGRGHTHHIH